MIKARVQLNPFLGTVLEGLECEAERVKQKLSEAERDLAQAKEELAKPFPYEEEMQEKLRKQIELNSAFEDGMGA